MSIKNKLYPHLLPPDIEVWERYLKDHKAEYNFFDYDVRVGNGKDPGPKYNDTIRQMAIDLTQRRIDAIGYKNDSITIIEITRSIGLKAIGQIKVYKILYKIKFNPHLPVNTLILGEYLQSDIAPYLDESGQKYILI